MEKIDIAQARERIEFQVADRILKSYVHRAAAHQAASNWENIDMDTRKVEHWNLVVRITKLYMVVLSALSEDLVGKINKTQGNLFKINKFLALRQLAQTQLTGLTQGTWDLDSRVVSKELFSKNVSAASCPVTTQEIEEEINKDFDIKLENPTGVNLSQE